MITSIQRSVDKVSSSSIVTLTVVFDSATNLYEDVIVKCDNEALVTHDGKFPVPTSGTSFVYNIKCGDLSSVEQIKFLLYGNQSQAVVTFDVAQPSSVALSMPSKIQGGANFALLVTIDAAATSSQLVALEEVNSVENPKILVVPSTVTIATDYATNTANIVTKVVPKNTKTFIKATYNGQTVTQAIEVTK